MEDGLPSGYVNAIVQSKDGFLWIGTRVGLARFNGKKFTPVYFRGPEGIPQGAVRSLAMEPNGDLWIGTGTGIARLPRKALQLFDRSLATFYNPGFDKSNEINCLHFNRDGSLWIGTASGLFHREGSHIKLVLPRVAVSRLEESLVGHMLVTSSEGPFELDGNRVIAHDELAKRPGVPAQDVFDVFDDHSGSRWICAKEGLFRQTGVSAIAIGPHSSGRSAAFRIVEDRQRNLWVFTSEGLFRASLTGLELVAFKLNAATAFTDADGNLWIGRKGDGLVRFKDRPIQMTESLDRDGHRTIPTTVLSDRRGRLWIGNTCGGISQFEGGKFTTYAEKDGLTNSCVYALAEDALGNLWVGTWGGGIYKFSHGKFTQYSSADGLADNVVKAILAARDGSIWVATDDGLSQLQNGTIRNFRRPEGLSGNRVNNVFQDSRGNIWAATSEGINRLNGDRFVTVHSEPKILDSDHTGFAEDSSRNLYALSAPRGISRIINDTLIAIKPDIELASMAETSDKDLWFAGSDGIFRLPANEVGRKTNERETPLDFERFGHADGLTSPQCSSGVPNMTTTSDGKLWVATTQGLAALELATVYRSNRRAAPYLDSITVGSTKLPAGGKLTLLAGTHHVELHFESIELTSPEKIRFQYRLDNVDTSWLDADTTQTAVYTSIPIGSHVFHIRACNKDGVWDPEGITYEVTQKPFFVETVWFRLGVLGAFLFLLAGAYRLRLRQIGKRYNLLLDERVTERTRIARELHDTLLQSFHGLTLRFQAVQNMLPEGRARESLQIAINHAAEAITEGRDAVQELRRDSVSRDDLVQTLTALGQELGPEQGRNGEAGNSVTFRVLVEGKPKQIRAALRGDLRQIASEAIRNAFRHAQADRIEVDIRYEEGELRLRIRDNGAGMDPKLLRPVGREGHWGLPGMRERARRMGGELTVWSELNRGTEIEVKIPGAVAYSRVPNSDNANSVAS